MKLTKCMLPFCLIAASLALAPPCRAGGPPFLTDDPEPVEYLHWEFYTATQHFRDASGWTGTAPHFEMNYGAAPEVQLHIIVPLAYSAPSGFANQFGLGDIELGVKYRFMQETRSHAQIGIFPLIETPTGDSNRQLGNGVAQFFLPVWLQKSWGDWTTYGGGGYWRNPGNGNRDYWYVGWLLQRKLSEHLTIGGELFHTTPDSVDGSSRTGGNLGLIYDIDDGHHLLFSAGDDLRGTGRGMVYCAYQWTYGPHSQSQESMRGVAVAEKTCKAGDTWR